MKFKFLPPLKKGFSGKRKIKPVVIYAAIVLAVLIPAIYIVNNRPEESRAMWYDEAWVYREALQVSNPGSTLTDFQVNFTIDTATLIASGKMQADCGDIRMTSSDGSTLIDFWLEENNPGCNNSATSIWVEIPSIAAGDSEIYVYYGNVGATDVSSGTNTFPFFDDFNSGSLDTAKWTATGATSFSGGAMTVTTGSVYTDSTIVATAQDYMYEMRTKWIDDVDVDYSGMMIVDDQSTASVNAQSDQLMYLMIQRSIEPNTSEYDEVDAWGSEGGGAGYSFSGDTVYIMEADTYQVAGFSMTSTQMRYYEDRVQTVIKDFTWSQAPYMYLGYFTGSAASTTDVRDMTTDWVLARKFSTTPPTTQSLSGDFEETVGNAELHWKFDEGTGTTLNDSSNNGNSATLAGSTATPTWIAEDRCIDGKCLQFDGTDDYATSGEDTFYSDAFTVCAWVRPNLLDANSRSIIVKRNSSGVTSGTAEWWLIATSSVVSFSVWDSGNNVVLTINTPEALSLNEWSHVCAANGGNGNTSYVYINGREKGSGTPTAAVRDGDSHLTIGGRTATNNNRYWTGFIDEIKIYAYQRSAAEIKSDYIEGAATAGSQAVLGFQDQEYLSEGLTGYWKLDEEASPAQDSSGNAGIGGTWVGNSFRVGKYNFAADFNSDGDYISIADNTVHESSSVTMSAWINGSAFGDDWIISKQTSTPTDYEFGYLMRTDNSNSIVCAFGDGTTQQFIQSAADSIVINTWHLATCTFDGTTRQGRLYIDGELMDTDTYGGSIVYTNVSNMYIGGHPTTAGFRFNGRIDEARVYNRVLSQREVTSLYEWAPSPIAFWNFNDNTGTTLTDIGSDPNNGTLGAGTSAPQWGSGKFGSGLNFDGSNDYVNVGIRDDILRFDLTESVTIGAWAKRDSNASTIGRIISNYPGTSSPPEFINLGYDISGNANFSFRDTGSNIVSLLGSTSLNDDKWHYISGVRNRETDTVYLYVDGILVDSDTDTATTAMGSDEAILTYIGANESSGASVLAENLMEGTIDEIRVYNYARSQKQIVQDMNAGHPTVGTPVASPIMHLRMDEGSGTTLNNVGVGGTGLNGTLGVGSSAPAWANSGFYSKALTFDGTNDIVTVPDSDALDSVGQITLSAWVKTSDAADFDGIIFKNSSNDGYKMGFSTSGGVRADFYNGTNNLSPTFSGFNVEDGEWHNVVATYDGLDATIYVDGVRGTTQSGAGYVTATTAVLTMAKDVCCAGRFYEGQMDEIKIYNFALSPDEVRTEYNAGKALVLGSVSTSSAGVGDNSADREVCVPGDSSTCSAPDGQWNFDENTGTSAFDSSENENTGTLGAGSSAPVWSTGIVGSALDYDGSNDYVNMGDVTTFDGLTQMTMSAWIKPDSVPAGANIESIVAKGDYAATTTNAYFMRLRGTEGLRANWSDGTNQVACDATMPTAGIWTHVVAVLDTSDNCYVYYNGVEIVTSSNTSFTSVTNNAITLRTGGSQYASELYFDGKIDQVRLYNFGMTPAQVAWEYNKGDTIAHYKMDECEGSTIYNSTTTYNGSAAGTNGTLVIGATGTNTEIGSCTTSGSWFEGATGKNGASLDFDDTDDYVTVGDAALWEVDPPFSMSVWVNTDGVSSSEADTIASKYNSANLREWYFALSGTSATPLFVKYSDGLTGTAAVLAGSHTLTSGQWYHLVFTMDEDAIGNMYVNGNLSATGSMTDTTIFHSTAQGMIGRLHAGGTGSNFFDGQIDDYKIFNYVLTPQQVKSDYNGGAVNFRE